MKRHTELVKDDNETDVSSEVVMTTVEEADKGVKDGGEVEKASDASNIPLM